MYVLNHIDLGTGGVAACTRCSSVSRAPLPASDILHSLSQVLERASAEPCQSASSTNVIFGGFEPFRHPDLVQVLSTVADDSRGAISRIGIQTDGGALSVSSNALGSISSQVSLFEIFLRGGDEASHDTLTSEKGLFHLALMGIAGARAAAEELDKQIFMVGVAALCSHNRHLLPAIVTAFVQAGVDAIRVENQDDGELGDLLIAQSYEIATTAGILLFGDGCTRIESATLYHSASKGS